MKRSVLAVTLATLVSILFVGRALAAWYSYNVIVPKFGGSAYTSYQRKDTPSGWWAVNSIGVGGSYQVYVTMNQGGDISNSYLVDDWTAVSALYTTVPGVGSYVRMRVGNHVYTPVDVQAYGSWTPDG